MSGYRCFWCGVDVHPLDTDHKPWCPDFPRFITRLMAAKAGSGK